jgi:hypothetical protein
MAIRKPEHFRRLRGWIVAWCLLASTAAACAATKPDGAAIYLRLCAECHGSEGQGVRGKFDDPLVGDDSLDRLTRIIHKTMPEDAEDKCVDADAAAVAEFVYHEFYSPNSRLRQGTARVELSRLTVRQYRESVADLIGSFLGRQRIDESRGLSADYYKSRGYSDKKHAYKRIDETVEFDFGTNSPAGDGFKNDEFSVRWRGSLRVDETGWHEFVLQTENGAQLNLNGGEKALIDGYVATGDKDRKQKARIFLIGGRAYPLELEWFKYKEATASVKLSWIPPHGVEEVIPARNLSPVSTRPTMVVKQVFPPDDSSAGYERGVAISRSWDDAATYGALEVVNWVSQNLNQLSGSRPENGDWKERLKTFCGQFTERAFRRPLDAEQRRFFVDRFFEGEDPPELAVKRAVLLTLKSPRFLYIGLHDREPDDHVMAERLAFSLWDSIPDRELLQQAERGQLRQEPNLKRQADRMLKDPRAASKIRHFFQTWLKMNETEAIVKDTKVFPGFDSRIIADLRTSLNLSLDEVFWGGSSDYRQLLLSDHLYMNDRLARFYGVDYKGKGEFRKIAFRPKERAGVMTHPYVLSTFAYHQTTSPIHRGVFVSRNLLGRALRPPQMAIEFKDSEFDPSLTMREKVDQMTRPAACQSCHSVINPVGFSLEQYDAVGRFRTKEGDKGIDPTVEYQETDGSIVKLRGAYDLAKYVAESDDAQRGFIRQVFHVVVKQPIAAYGTNALDRLHAKFVASEYRIHDLLVEIAALSAAHGMN